MNYLSLLLLLYSPPLPPLFPPPPSPLSLSKPINASPPRHLPHPPPSPPSSPPSSFLPSLLSSLLHLLSLSRPSPPPSTITSSASSSSSPLSSTQPTHSLPGPDFDNPLAWAHLQCDPTMTTPPPSTLLMGLSHNGCIGEILTELFPTMCGPS